MENEIVTPELIQACLRGEQVAYTELYEQAAPLVYRLAYSLLLHRQDAEDVVQEVFVYVFRSLHQYNPERGSFKTWLYTITVSRSRNARRRKVLPMVDMGYLLQFGKEPSTSSEHSPETAALRNDARRMLGDALKTLSPRLREAVALRYGNYLSYREMSAILNIPEKTAESRVRLAHSALRKAMQANDVALIEELLPI